MGAIEISRIIIILVIVVVVVVAFVVVIIITRARAHARTHAHTHTHDWPTPLHKAVLHSVPWVAHIHSKLCPATIRTRLIK